MELLDHTAVITGAQRIWSGEPLVATHLSFPSVCRVAVAGNTFRCVPAVWDY
jgi:hypothetical protein